MTPLTKRVQYERAENGVDVYILPVRENDVVVCHLCLPGGYAASYDRQALVEVLVQALPGSTRAHSRRAILERFEEVGAEVAVDADGGWCTVTLSSRHAVFPEVFRSVIEVLCGALFPEREVAEALTQVTTALHHAREDTRSCARHSLMDALYAKGHPHWSPSIAALERDLTHVTPPLLRELWRAVRATSGAFVCVAGDVAAPGVRDAVRDAVSLLPQQLPQVPELSVAHVGAPATKDMVQVVRDRMNIDTCLGIPLSLTRESDAYLPLTLAVGVLGGSATSRLFHTLRTKESLTYGSYALLEGFTDGYPGHLVASAVFPRDVFIRGRAVLREVVRTFAERGVTRAELATRKGEIAGRYVVGLSTTSGVCGALAAAIRSGKSPEYLDEFPARIAAVTHRAVQDAIAEHIRYDRAITAAAGEVAREER